MLTNTHDFTFAAALCVSALNMMLRQQKLCMRWFIYRNKWTVELNREASWRWITRCCKERIYSFSDACMCLSPADWRGKKYITQHEAGHAWWWCRGEEIVGDFCSSDFCGWNIQEAAGGAELRQVAVSLDGKSCGRICADVAPYSGLTCFHVAISVTFLLQRSVKCGCRYRFISPHLQNLGSVSVCETAHETADSLPRSAWMWSRWSRWVCSADVLSHWWGPTAVKTGRWVDFKNTQVWRTEEGWGWRSGGGGVFPCFHGTIWLLESP